MTDDTKTNQDALALPGDDEVKHQDPHIYDKQTIAIRRSQLRWQQFKIVLEILAFSLVIGSFTYQAYAYSLQRDAYRLQTKEIANRNALEELTFTLSLGRELNDLLAIQGNSLKIYQHAEQASKLSEFYSGNSFKAKILGETGVQTYSYCQEDVLSARAFATRMLNFLEGTALSVREYPDYEEMLTEMMGGPAIAYFGNYEDFILYLRDDSKNENAFKVLEEFVINTRCNQMSMFAEEHD